MILPEICIKDSLREEVERKSEGRNTIIRDNLGNPNWMVVISKFTLDHFNLGSEIHPAFIIDGKEKNEILIGKYMASKGSGNIPRSVANALPWTRISFLNAFNSCRKMGKGFHLASNALYAANALSLLKKLDTQWHYAGNTDCGRDAKQHWLIGRLGNKTISPGSHLVNNPDIIYSGGTTFTGSGGSEWNDDGTEIGIADLIGNAWEWCSGFRLVDGEIQIIENNNAMSTSYDGTCRSKMWKTINENGYITSQHNAYTLKFDAPCSGNGDKINIGKAVLSTEIKHHCCPKGYMSSEFSSLTAKVNVPSILQSLGLFPLSKNGIKGHYWIRNSGEIAAVRGGGDWSDGLTSGPFALFVYHTRLVEDWRFSFRPAFVP